MGDQEQQRTDLSTEEKALLKARKELIEFGLWLDSDEELMDFRIYARMTQAHQIIDSFHGRYNVIRAGTTIELNTKLLRRWAQLNPQQRTKLIGEMVKHRLTG